tara:strand:- start:94 stop:759 length:666 start_codon:yes stop_codon:yes gene_type:complete
VSDSNTGDGVTVRGESLTHHIKTMAEYGKTPQIAIKKVQPKETIIKNVIAGLLSAGVLTACIGSGGDDLPEEVKPLKNAPIQKTEIRTKEDLLTGNTNYTLSVSSDTTVANVVNISEKATIIARCKNGELDTYVSTPTYNADHESVDIRWNDGRAANEYWSKAKSSDALFANKPRTFLELASKADTLVFGWKPYQRQKVAAKWSFTDQNRKDFKSMLQRCS